MMMRSAPENPRTVFSLPGSDTILDPLSSVMKSFWSSTLRGAF